MPRNRRDDPIGRTWETIDRGIWIGQPHLKRGDARWRVIVKRKDYSGGLQRFVEGGPDRATAEAVARQLSRRLGAAGSSRVTVDALLRAYEQAHIRTLRHTTESLFAGYVKNHLVPHFAGRAAVDLQKADLFDFGAAMLARLEPEARARRFSTLKNCLSVLRAALNWYWRTHEGTMREHRNPAVDVPETLKRIRQRFDIPRRRTRPAYSAAELRILMGLAAELDLLVHDLFAISVGTGLRLSECLGLQWANVDELRARIVPDERGRLWRIDTGGKPALYKSEREGPVAMPRGLLEVFRRRRQLRSSETWVCADAEGKPFQRTAVSDRIRAVRRAAAEQGVPMEKTFHSARHSFATLSLDAGQSLVWVQNQLGHASAAFTAEMYTHLVDRERDLSFVDFGHRSQPANSAEDGAEEPHDGTRLN
jgi:integrase